MFSISTHSLVTSMISVTCGSTCYACETEIGSFALLPDISPSVRQLTRLSFCWIWCMSVFSMKTLGCFWKIPIYLSIGNPSNSGPLASTIWNIGFMYLLSHWQFMTLTSYCWIVLPPYAFRVLSLQNPTREFPASSNCEGFTFLEPCNSNGEKYDLSLLMLYL